MVSGEIKIEDIVKVEATRYEWCIEGVDVTEEIIFSLGNGQVFVVTGADGFFKKIQGAIELHKLFVNELGKKIEIVEGV